MVAELLNAALALSEVERAELAVLLEASLTPSPGSMHPSWAAELHRRAAEVDSGQLTPVPWDEVRRQVQAQLDACSPHIPAWHLDEVRRRIAAAAEKPEATISLEELRRELRGTDQ